MSWSTSSSLIENTTYSEDERINLYLRQIKTQEETEKLNVDKERQSIFDQVFSGAVYRMFKLPGLTYKSFTHKRIRIQIVPSKYIKKISKTYEFSCTLRYMRKYGKWHITREPMPVKPVAFNATKGKLLIEDSISELNNTIIRIYKILHKHFLFEVAFRKERFEMYKKNKLSFLELDSIDEELYFSDTERQTFFEKRQAILRRMLPPRRTALY